MQHYELMYIISLKFAGEQLQPIIEDVAKKIKDLGGEITRDENMGRMKFAYPIKHNHQGFYILLEFDMKKKKIQKLHDWFLLKQEVLRYMIINKDYEDEVIMEKKENTEARAEESPKEERSGKTEEPEVVIDEIVEDAVAEEKPEEAEEKEAAEKEPEKEKPETKEVSSDLSADLSSEALSKGEAKAQVEAEKKEESSDQSSEALAKGEPESKGEKKSKKKEKLSLDELDKKLDELLDSDDML